MFGDPEENPMNWPIKQLSDVAKVDGTMTKEYEKYANLPHIGIDSMEKNTGILSGYRTVKEDNVISPKYHFGPQHILYSKIRPALNKVAVPDFEGLCSADCYPLLPIDGFCERKFLAHVLRSDYFLRYVLSFSVRSQMPKVNRKQLEGFAFPCPPVELQRKFIILVEQSNKSKFISFKSQFIEMFGDPDNNSKNWPLVSLKDCLVAIDSGKSITCENYPRTGDLPAILKLSAVTYGEYQPEENKQLPLAEQFIKEAEVHVGDLLFSRKNTLEYVGMTALVKQTPPKLMIPDLIFRLVPQENVRPQYLHQLINHPMYRGTISGLANGSAGSMPNISKQKLNTLAIPLPPVELQMEIEPFIEQSDK